MVSKTFCSFVKSIDDILPSEDLTRWERERLFRYLVECCLDNDMIQRLSGEYQSLVNLINPVWNDYKFTKRLNGDCTSNPLYNGFETGVVGSLFEHKDNFYKIFIRCIWKIGDMPTAYEFAACYIGFVFFDTYPNLRDFFSINEQVFLIPKMYFYEDDKKPKSKK